MCLLYILNDLFDLWGSSAIHMQLQLVYTVYNVFYFINIIQVIHDLKLSECNTVSEIQDIKLSIKYSLLFLKFWNCPTATKKIHYTWILIFFFLNNILKSFFRWKKKTIHAYFTNNTAYLYPFYTEHFWTVAARSKNQRPVCLLILISTDSNQRDREGALLQSCSGHRHASSFTLSVKG